MTSEIKRYAVKALYWIILATALVARGFLAYFDFKEFKYEPDVYLDLVADYWNKAGSLSLAILILIVLIHQFSFDKETGADTVIHTARYGRRRLYLERLGAGVVMTVFSVAILGLGNYVISYFMSPVGVHMRDVLAPYIESTLITLVGGVGFFLASSFVCDVVANHPAAICICGFPYAFSYFVYPIEVNKNLKLFDLFWFLKYGTFTELVRGRWITTVPVFWCIWYPMVIAGLFALSIYKRKERKQL